MTNMGPRYFHTGVPDSKVASLPSYPRNGKEAAGEVNKTRMAIKRFLWGGCTVEIKSEKDKGLKESDE